MIRVVMAEVWVLAGITATMLEPANPGADRVGRYAGIVPT